LARKINRRNSQIVTIHDVASHVGVSPMTVSRVINGERNVKEETRQKVLAAVEALNYSPNLAARSLATQDAARVALLYSNPSAAYLSEFLLGILEQSAQSGTQLLIESCQGPEGVDQAIDKLRGIGTDGFILPPPLSDSARVIAALKAHNTPFVCIASAHMGAEVSSVCIDDFLAARSMTERLLALGHRDIGFIKGHPNLHASQLRYDGYIAAMEAAGVEVDPTHVGQGFFTYRSGFDAAELILGSKVRPTAIFASNDDMAAGAVATAHRLGLDVPRDLSIAGFDDTAMASSTWPELTTVRQPINDMAAVGFKVLLDQIRTRRSGAVYSPVQEVRDFALIERQSTRPPEALRQGG
jgi:LacI family transcriptional regulator